MNIWYAWSQMFDDLGWGSGWWVLMVALSVCAVGATLICGMCSIADSEDGAWVPKLAKRCGVELEKLQWALLTQVLLLTAVMVFIAPIAVLLAIPAVAMLLLLWVVRGQWLLLCVALKCMPDGSKRKMRAYRKAKALVEDFDKFLDETLNDQHSRRARPTTPRPTTPTPQGGCG